MFYFFFSPRLPVPHAVPCARLLRHAPTSDQNKSDVRFDGAAALHIKQIWIEKESAALHPVYFGGQSHPDRMFELIKQQLLYQLRLYARNKDTMETISAVIAAVKIGLQSCIEDMLEGVVQLQPHSSAASITQALFALAAADR